MSIEGGMKKWRWILLTSLRHEDVNKRGLTEGNVVLRADLKSAGHLGACLWIQTVHWKRKRWCCKVRPGESAVAKSCGAVLTLSPPRSPQVTDQSVKAFAEHCPELQCVGFMGCSVTSKGVIHLTKVGSMAASPRCFPASIVPMPSQCSTCLNEDWSDHYRAVSSVW